MGRPKKKQTDVMIYIRAPKELAERLKAEAKANARDLSSHVRYLLENYVKL